MASHLDVSRRYLMVLLTGGILFPILAAPQFKAIIWATRDPWHFQIDNARKYIEQLAVENNFQADFSEDVNKHTDAFLADYQLYINLNLEVTPFTAEQKAAFEKFINSGKGWVGIHKGGINKADWPWYDAFMGGTRFNDHPYWEHALMNVEDTTHPATRAQPSRYYVWDECFQFKPTPSNVRVLANLDEKTYSPKYPMGYHPIVWCNEKYSHTIYIGIGHSDSMWTREQNFRAMVKNAILWAGQSSTATLNYQPSGLLRTHAFYVNQRNVSLELPGKQFTATLIDARGRLAARRESENGRCMFDRTLFGKGVYIAHIAEGANIVTERVVVP
jgi:type 1 glutamine amidotransferase